MPILGRKNRGKGLPMAAQGSAAGHDHHDQHYGEKKLTESTRAFPPIGESAAAQQSTAGVARDEAANVGQAARAAAGNVTSTAADQARNVVEESRQQAVGLLGEARSQVREQAMGQQRKAVQNLHTLAGQLNEMAARNGDSGMATRLAEEAANRVHGVAAWLDGREPADLLDEVRGFARRRPGAFLFGAALAGVLAGRMTRGAATAARSGEPGSSGRGQSGGVSADALDAVQPAGTWPAPAPGPGPAPGPRPGAGPGTEFGRDLPGAGYHGEDASADLGGDYSYRPGQP
jgi:hypothetical protein